MHSSTWPTIVIMAIRCVAWLAGSSAGCSACRLNASYYLLRGGFLSYSSLSDAGSRGYYWSSTPNGFSYAYGLYFGSGYVDTYLNYRYLGYSVRCVAAG